MIHVFYLVGWNNVTASKGFLIILPNTAGGGSLIRDRAVRKASVLSRLYFSSLEKQVLYASAVGTQALFWYQRLPHGYGLKVMSRLRLMMISFHADTGYL